MADILARGLRGSAILDRAVQPDLPVVDQAGGMGQMERGLRSSLFSNAVGSLAAEGLQAEVAGDKATAAAKYREAQRVQQQGADFAPRVHSIRDVNGVGDFVDYAAGGLPQVVTSTLPAIAGAVVGRGIGGRVGAMAGGMVPAYNMEANETAGELAMDPRARARMSPQEIQDVMRTKGAINMGLEAAGPAYLIERAVGNAARKEGLRGAARTIGMGGVMEGPLTELPQEAVGQAAQSYARTGDLTKEIDPWALADAAIQGQIGGHVMAMPAAGAQLAGAAVEKGLGKARDAAALAAEKAQQGGAVALDAGETAIDLAAPHVSPILDTIKSKAGTAYDSAKVDFLSAQDESLPDGMTDPAAVMEHIAANDSKRKQMIAEHLTGVANDEAQPAERRAQAADLLKNLDNPETYSRAANLVVGMERGKQYASRVKDFAEDGKDFLKGFISGKKQNAQATESTQAGDATQQLVMQDLTSALPPEAADVGAGDMLPHFASLFSGKVPGRIAPRLMRDFIGVYGDRAVEVAATIADRVVRDNPKALDAKRTASLMADIMANADARMESRQRAVMENLTNEARVKIEQELGRPLGQSDYTAVADLMARFADHTLRTDMRAKVRYELQKYFGDRYKHTMNIFNALHDADSRHTAVLAHAEESETAEDTSPADTDELDYEEARQQRSFETMMEGKGREFSLAAAAKNGVAKLFDSREEAQKRWDEKIKPVQTGFNGSVIRGDQYADLSGVDPVALAAQYDDSFKKAMPEGDFKAKAEQIKRAMELLRTKHAVQMDPVTNEDSENLSAKELGRVLSKSRLPIFDRSAETTGSRYASAGEGKVRDTKPTAADGYIFAHTPDGKAKPVKMSALVYAIVGKQQKGVLGGTADENLTADAKMRTVMTALARLEDSGDISFEHGVFAYDANGNQKWIIAPNKEGTGKAPGALKVGASKLGELYKKAVEERATEEKEVWGPRVRAVAAREVDASKQMSKLEDAIEDAKGKGSVAFNKALKTKRDYRELAINDLVENDYDRLREVAEENRRTSEQSKDRANETDSKTDTDSQLENEIVAAQARRSEDNLSASSLDQATQRLSSFKTWDGLMGMVKDAGQKYLERAVTARDAKLGKKMAAKLESDLQEWFATYGVVEGNRKGAVTFQEWVAQVLLTDAMQEGKSIAATSKEYHEFKRLASLARNVQQNARETLGEVHMSSNADADLDATYADVARRTKEQSRSPERPRPKSEETPAKKSQAPQTRSQNVNDGNARTAENTQEAGKRSSPRKIAEAKEYLTKTLGSKIEVQFKQDLGGISGEWEEGATQNVIRIAMNAGPGVLSVAYHESIHEFFSRLTKSGQKTTADLLLRTASNENVRRQLDVLLNNEPAALAAIAKDPEELLAYAYQFWAQRKADGSRMLTLNPAGNTLFGKIKQFFRKITGMLTDEQAAEEILSAFYEGKMAEPSAAGKVIAELGARGETLRDFGKKMKPLYQKAFAFTMPAYDVLSTSNNPAAQQIAKILYTPLVGENDGQWGTLNAQRVKIAEWDDRFASVVGDMSKEELELLRKLKSAKEPTTNKRVAMAAGGLTKLLKDFHSYLKSRDVKLGYREDYFPRVWNFEKIAENKEAFSALLLQHYTPVLERMAKTNNDALTKEQLKNPKLVDTAERVAKRIANHMTMMSGVENDHGSVHESKASAGYTPYMMAVNEMKLDFIDDAVVQEYLEQDLVKIMTSYLKQGVRRAEYEYRAGKGGVKLHNLLEEAYDNEFQRVVDDKGYRGEYDAVKRNLEGKNALRVAKGQRPLDMPSNIEILAEALGIEAAKEVGAEAFEETQRYTEAVHAMEGTIGYDKITPGWRKFNSWMTAYQNMRLLPLVLFSSMIDPLGFMVRGGTLDDTLNAYKRGMKEVIASWRGQENRDELTKLAEMLGVIEHQSFLDTLGYVHESMYMNSKAKKVSDTFFRLNGMEAWNRAVRTQATAAALSFIEENFMRPGEHSERWLKELGLTEADIKFGKDGKMILSMDGFKASGMSDEEARAAADKMQMAVNQWVDGAMLRPNAALRPSWSSDPRWSLLFYLKQFTYAFHKTFLSRVRNEYKHGNTAPMVAMLPFVPTMIAADVLRGMIQNGGDLAPYMRNWGPGDYLMHGVQRAGLTGIYQFGIEEMDHPTDILGPVVQQGVDLFTKPMGENLKHAIPGGSIANVMAD